MLVLSNDTIDNIGHESIYLLLRLVPSIILYSLYICERNEIFSFYR